MKRTKRGAAGRRKPQTAERGGVVVRRAAKKDIAAIAALSVELARFHEAREKSFKTARGLKSGLAEHKAGQLRRRNVRFAVAQAEGDIIGYCLSVAVQRPPIFKTRRVLHILDMCVTARMRRRGVGHLLFEDAVAWAKSRGIRRIEVAFAPSNEISSRFWPGLGFKTFIESGYLEI